MAKTRRSYKGGATSTTITGTLASNGTNFVIAAYTGWPYGSNPFYVVIEPGTANEEKILVTRSGATDTTVNVTTRGADDTTAAQHAAGSTVYPVFTAVDADEANELAATMTSKGDILTHDTSTFARLAVGTNAYVLKADSSASTGLAWGQVATAGIADDAVTSAKIAADAVGSSEIAAGAVGEAELASSAVTEAKIGSGAVTAAKLGSSAVETAKINDSAVTTAKINDGAVTNAKLGLTEVKVRQTTSITLPVAPSTTEGYFVWDTEDSDADGFISVSSDTLTVPSGKAGMYVVSAETTGSIVTNSLSLNMRVYVFRDGVLSFFPSDAKLLSITNSTKSIQSDITLLLNVGDQVKVRYENAAVNGGSPTVTSRLWMTRIMD
jgi:hypothetical protein